MVNFGLNTASFLGIILAVAGAGLYFLRSIRPELSRDQDIAFTAIGIICGFILIFQGWRLDPILQFGQLLLSGSAIYFAYESIKMRGILNEQAKETSPIVDERPVSRRYKAEIEDREYLDERPRNSRRIRGDSVATASRSESRRSDRRVEDNEQPRRRSATRQLSEDRYATDESPRRRTASARAEVSSLVRRPNDDWDNDDDWNEAEATAPVRRALPDADLNANRSARRSTRRSAERTDPAEPDRESPEERLRQRDFDTNPDVAESQPRRRRPRTTGEASRRDDRSQPNTSDRDDTRQGEGTTANYVDYEPVDPPSGLPPSGAEPVVFPDRY